MGLHMRERNVWAKSEEIKKYPTLLKYVLTNDESNLTQNDKAILNSKTLKEELSMAIRAEWELDSSKGVNPVEFDRKNRQVCDRCENKTLIYVFYIKNKKNANTMQVGRECIGEVLIGEEKKKIVDVWKLKSDKRRVLLENILPGILDDIKTLGSLIGSCKVVVPQKLKEKYINSSNDFRKKYQLYISQEKTPDKNAEQVKQEVIRLYHENEDIKAEIKKYEIEAKNNPFIAYKSYLKDLPATVHKEVEESGLVGKQAIYKLQNSAFNKRVQGIISETVSQYGIFIASSNLNGFVYSVHGRMESFIISLQNIVELVCEEIYGELQKSNCSKENFLLSSKFCDSEDVEIATERLLKGTGYSFSIDDEYNELTVYRSDIFDRIESGELSKKQNNARLLRLSEFKNKFKDNLLLGTKAKRDDIFRYIETGENINIESYQSKRRNFNQYK
ncbi:MAG: hypothetical protein RR639_04790 [Hydrogenoanaerobacterium sp.]